MKNKLKLTIALFGVAGLTANGSWTLTNALDVSEDLALVEAFDHFEGEVGDPGTLTLIEDPTGVLKNLDGTPAIVVEALGSQTEGAAFVQSYGFPGLADSVYTVYYRWMYPTGGGRSHQELATLSGQSEILVDGSLLKGNGPWYHNWSSLGFCYNGGGSWVCEPPLGAFLADTWYEYWMVIDPVNVSYDWYIRGGDFTDISVVYLDAIYANIDNVAPLKALQQVHYMGQGGLFGPQYYDAMYIDLTGENLVTPSDLGSIHGAAGGSNWTLANALDVSEDLALVDIFDSFTGDVGDPGTLTLIEDPTGVLKNLDGTPAIVVEALGSQTDGAAFVQSYNLPATPTDSIYTVYYRWMYPTGGTRSHQELATLSGESEILVDGSLIKGNGPWYHNWSDLNFCYNGGGSWVCGPALGGYLADTWYEYFMVIDPANISYDWYIRGGDFTDVTLIFEDALYANLDSVAPLKAIQEVHYMGQGGLFGPQYYDAMYIDLTGENLVTPSDLGSIHGGGPAITTWAGYSVDENGWVDTGSWMGHVNVTHGDWLYVYAIESFVFMKESSVQVNGAWGFILNVASPTEG